MILIYQVVVSRAQGEDTLLLTTDRWLAVKRARDYNQSPVASGEAMAVVWVDGEHNWAYVDLLTLDFYQIDDEDGGRTPVPHDFSFSAMMARGEMP